MYKKFQSIIPHSVVITLFFLFLWIIGCDPGVYEKLSGHGSHKGSDSDQGTDDSSEGTANLNVNVTDSGGDTLSGFRWLLEEDTTYLVTPGDTVTDSLGVSIHRSYAPVVAKGISYSSTVNINAPSDKRCMLSVLPLQLGYTMSGTIIEPGQTVAKVVVHKPPIPTAQISVFVFHDNKPLNNAPDIPTEQGLEGFSVIISDIAGQQMMDVFGNMLGTTYLKDGSTYLTDAEGNPIVDMHGNGYVKTDANGEALIQNLAPGKYGVQVIPPAGEDWIQTSTIEGTPTVDAWVKAGEPQYFSEFGVFMWHTFYGFVKPMVFSPPAGPVGTITGQAVYLHANRPPADRGVEPGKPVETGWVALNDLNANDDQVYAQPCDNNGFFTIENVPPGTYQLVIWDWALDVIMDFRTVIVPETGGTIDLGKLPVFAWFGFFEGSVFFDTNMDGYRDPGENGIPKQLVAIRFTDGSIYKEAVTNPLGDFCFPEVFPFFYWLVAEVDFGRYKATGATFIVDDGGPLAPGAKNNPQLQPENGDLPWRAETGEVLTHGMLLYAGQTNEIHWGKSFYGPGENGGISGIVFYATTRAEDDPRLAAAEPWETGIPRVQVALYADSDFDGVIDDMDSDGLHTLADVDNHPFGWMDGSTIGPEDVDRNGNTLFDPGDAINIVTTDSWDDNHPTGAVGPVQTVYGHTIQDGAETYRTWNQLRPGVFDGGYAFSSYYPNGIVSGNTEVDGLPAGYYIVEASPPPGYEIIKEEDKNVDFGEQYAGVAAALKPVLGPPVCVGDDHTVPNELSLFPGVEAPFAGTVRQLCDRKSIYLKEGLNAAVDFFLFTEVPKAGRIWGMVLDDLKYEYDPNSPNKGTNFAPSWIPVSINDWSGHEITRVYTDEWGRYNALVPSTYTTNLAAPSGMSPNILVACMNDPGPVPDPANPGLTMIDPWYNPAYGQVCLNFDFLPGKTTRLDTPIVPIGAFTANRTPINCEYPDGTPVIGLVSGPTGGPYVPTTGNMITITSLGTVPVPNPDYPTDPNPEVLRDYGFGSIAGTVTVDGHTLQNVFWNNAVIIASVPPGVQSGQLEVTRADNGLSSMLGITLHVGGIHIPEVIYISDGETIQPKIDSASANALIILQPGVYKENLFLWKPLKLQGYGPYSTLLQAGPMDPQEQAAWEARLSDLVDTGKIELLPGQRDNLFLEKGPGVLVSFAQATSVDMNNPPLIDGIRITGAVKGGGIYVNTYAPYLQISNNRIESNQGSFGGGIRVGTPSLVDPAGTGYLGSGNNGISIHHNHITVNGGIDGGGGIALFNGSDEYVVSDNLICGNFTLLYGGGIAHFGKSDNCSITNNKIVSNESFDEGGGIMISGELVPAEAPVDTLSPGSGSVIVDNNLVQGNLAGDDGGGIRTLLVSGQDVQTYPGDTTQWHRIELLNNIIVNNASADAGGGISLDNTALVSIINNTIAHNDSTSTSIDAFGGPCTPDNPPGQLCPAGAGVTTSIPQVAGIHARAHSIGLQLALSAAGYAQEFSDPILHDNIIWQNRSFYWDYDYNGVWGGLRPDVQGGETPTFWDLAVSGTQAPELMSPMYTVITDAGLYDVSNSELDPNFAGWYFNEYPFTSAGHAAIGNLITITFKPNGIYGDYHIMAPSSAVDLGGGVYLPIYPELQWDYDGDARPLGADVDAGADELQ